MSKVDAEKCITIYLYFLTFCIYFPVENICVLVKTTSVSYTVQMNSAHISEVAAILWWVAQSEWSRIVSIMRLLGQGLGVCLYKEILKVQTPTSYNPRATQKKSFPRLPQ